jgi:hypothetical protein
MDLLKMEITPQDQNQEWIMEMRSHYPRIPRRKNLPGYQLARLTLIDSTTMNCRRVRRLSQQFKFRLLPYAGALEVNQAARQVGVQF